MNLIFTTDEIISGDRSMPSRLQLSRDGIIIRLIRFRMETMKTCTHLYICTRNAVCAFEIDFEKKSYFFTLGPQLYSGMKL